MAEKERRTEHIVMKITPSLKAEAQRRAEEEGRTVSNYIEWLILKDIKANAKE